MLESVEQQLPATLVIENVPGFERSLEQRALSVVSLAMGSFLVALRHGQVRTLLVDPTVEQQGYRCSITGRLGVTEAVCEAEGTAEPVPDVIDEAIEEALRQGGHVEVVEDADARTGIAGLAALLRFRQR